MSVGQIDESEWKELTWPVAICTLPFTPEQFSAKYGIQFAEGREEGLGLSRYAFAQIGDVPCFLQAFPEASAEAGFLTVSVRSYQSNSERALQEILSGLELDAESLRWRAEGLGPARWVLCRLDDNGNESEMQRFLERESAERLKTKYDQKGHRQAYLVKEAGRQGPGPPAHDQP